MPAYLILSGGALLGAYAMYRWGPLVPGDRQAHRGHAEDAGEPGGPGFVEVKGRAKAARELLTSPASKKPCVYYRFFVEEWVKRGKSSSWRTRLDDEKECGLLVEDAWQGVIAVNLLEADLVLSVIGNFS